MPFWRYRPFSFDRAEKNSISPTSPWHADAQLPPGKGVNKTLLKSFFENNRFWKRRRDFQPKNARPAFNTIYQVRGIGAASPRWSLRCRAHTLGAAFRTLALTSTFLLIALVDWAWSMWRTGARHLLNHTLSASHLNMTAWQTLILWCCWCAGDQVDDEHPNSEVEVSVGRRVVGVAGLLKGVQDHLDVPAFSWPENSALLR